jgi:hypothetical protein
MKLRLLCNCNYTLLPVPIRTTTAMITTSSTVYMATLAISVRRIAAPQLHAGQRHNPQSDSPPSFSSSLSPSLSPSISIFYLHTHRHAPTLNTYSHPLILRRGPCLLAPPDRWCCRHFIPTAGLTLLQLRAMTVLLTYVCAVQTNQRRSVTTSLIWWDNHYKLLVPSTLSTLACSCC